MQPATQPFLFHPAHSSSHARFKVLLLALAASLGCGGSEVEGGADPGASGGSAATSNPTPSPTPSQGSPTSNGGQPPSTTPPVSTPGASDPPASEGNTRPASVDTAGVGAVCAAVGTSDACGACVCEECRDPLETCANTSGCAEILACVRENGCSGTDCFCGDAALTRCFAGNGNGPCKDVVLAAPGGKEPSLTDPSGGPASDAALEVGECADDDDTCADVCDVGL